MSSDVPHNGDEAVEDLHEPWNYEAFVRHHNAEANRLGRWPYIPDESTPDLQSEYEDSKFKTVKDFAEFMFRYEQVEVDFPLPKFMEYKSPKQ